MRYADNLAHGHGIVWNIGEAPVDGATDFLFLIVSGALIKVGVPVGRAVRLLGFVSHLLTVLLIYWVNRRVWNAGIAVAAFASLYLAVGPGLSYVAAFFGTPFFALASAATWALGLLLIHRERPPYGLVIGFSLTGLATGLIRPEGVVLAALMLLAVVLARGVRKSWPIVLTFAAVILVLGGAYFFWRWDYFGSPLPNPFYKKGGGVLHWDSLHASLLNTLRLALPFALAYLLAIGERTAARLAAAFLIPLVGFAVAFVLISDETNFGARFQYALLPVVLVSWIPLVRRFAAYWPPRLAGRERAAVVAGALAVAAALLYYSWSQNCHLTSYQQTCLAAYEADGRYDVGKMLGEYRGKGYVIATTEAGLLPYYSGWTAVDTWGLNDQWIAHNGDVTPAYLDRYKPHVIAFHAYFSPLVPPRLTAPNLAQAWFRMTITLKEYAEQRGYVLAAVFGESPFDTIYYYVRPDFEDSGRIITRISSMTKYYWFATGKKSINYALIGSD
jgi:hypothetical protein